MAAPLAITALAFALGSAPASPQADPLRAIYQTGNAPWQLALRKTEPLERWKQIHWVPLADALSTAQADGKPILVSIMSGALGQPNAPFT